MIEARRRPGHRGASRPLLLAALTALSILGPGCSGMIAEPPNGRTAEDAGADAAVAEDAAPGDAAEGTDATDAAPPPDAADAAEQPDATEPRDAGPEDAQGHDAAGFDATGLDATGPDAHPDATPGDAGRTDARPDAGPGCGDGVCASDEIGSTCSIDCPTPPPTAAVGQCGNGTCDRYRESPANCAGDCPRGSGSTCAQNHKVQDGTCDPAIGENNDTCPDDCAPILINHSPIRGLPDLGTNTYKGFVGGLYPHGQNTLPADHLAAGQARARAIMPLDTEGRLDAQRGKIVMISVGMSNTSQEFCHFDGVANHTADRCQSFTFMGRARDDATVNHSTLVIINGARGGMSIENWTTPPTPHGPPGCQPYSNTSAYTNSSLEFGDDHVFNDEYDRINACNLTAHGYNYRQVQVAWVKLTHWPSQAPGQLPYADADVYGLKQSLANVMRTLKARYPNLKQVFLSSRVYGGFTAWSLGEPASYEAGFAVKWLVETQINQMHNGGAIVEDSSYPGYAGDLDYDTVAPWIAWGAYIWANGSNPNADGLTWLRSDFYPAYASDFGEADGTHPNQVGEGKVGGALLDFFKTSPVTSCWFLAGQVCH